MQRDTRRRVRKPRYIHVYSACQQKYDEMGLSHGMYGYSKIPKH